ncbi:hypothetical protein KA977_07600 [Candidatus Dependentiae bacterium]|nr:hypothetical protein [Candidatus Dependentiae bacterium]
MDFLDKRGIDKKDMINKRWVDRYSSEENIINTFVEFNRRLRNLIPEPFSLSADDLTRNDDNTARKAIREALVNILIHMDYFDRKGARITVYDDRIELYNPGCLRFDKKRLFKEHITEPRNPSLAKIFRILQWAERTGEGMFTIRNGWTEFGFLSPKIKDDKELNYFELTLPLVKKTATATFTARIESNKKSDQDSEKVTKLSEKSDQVDEKVTKSLYNDKYDKLIKILEFPDKKEMTKPQLKIIENVRKILEKCLEPKEISDLMKLINQKHRTYFRNNYINIMLKAQLLDMVIPDKPNSPNQKYFTTNKGKEILN